MGKIAVVTDSAACLPDRIVREYKIHVVPFKLTWGQTVLRDGVDITPDEFYRLLQAHPTPPTTSQPSAGEFLALYQQLANEAEGIVSIHIPRTLSGTCNAAEMAARMLSRIPVRVIDCGTAAMAQGFIVREAARVARAGGTLDEVVAAAKAMIPRVHLLAILDRLDYLARSGRVRGVVAMVGSALHITPLFTIREGQVSVIRRARSKHRAIEAMIEAMEAHVGPSPVHVAVFHAGVPDEAEALRATIASYFVCVELLVTEFTPVMGAHTGPGVLGVAFYAE